MKSLLFACALSIAATFTGACSAGVIGPAPGSDVPAEGRLMAQEELSTALVEDASGQLVPWAVPADAQVYEAPHGDGIEIRNAVPRQNCGKLTYGWYERMLRHDVWLCIPGLGCSPTILFISEAVTCKNDCGSPTVFECWTTGRGTHDPHPIRWPTVHEDYICEEACHEGNGCEGCIPSEEG